MDNKKAWKIVNTFTGADHLSEDETILYEEALNYIFTVAFESNEACGTDLFLTDVEAGAYNLAAYYEKIGKYELAMKYYEISKKYGCSLAEEAINKIRAME
jgi:hypothetical protein